MRWSRWYARRTRCALATHLGRLQLVPNTLLQTQPRATTDGSVRGCMRCLGARLRLLWRASTPSGGRFALAATATACGTATNGIAGLKSLFARTAKAIHFELPVPLSDNKNRSCSAKFDICGGVEAPLFRAGFTDPAAWHAIRMAPAPWAELAGDVICINLPSKAIRELDDPLSVVSYWDEVVKCHAQLAGVPLPSRPERLVVDVQISAGYMHAGYPIMMHMDQLGNNHASDSPGLLDVATLRRKGNWGVFHEIGHNFQQPTWTFEGTGEVTVNWFSLHAMDKIVGIEPWKHPWLKNQKPNAAKYIKEGANFSKWQRDAGLALVTYALVQKMVGWGAFADTTRDYQTLSKEEEPKTLSEKIATFVCIMSKACELDLRAYFKTWGWPLDQDHPSLPELAALPSPPWAAKDAILYEIEHEN
eukprot:m.192774 g.192774  ORF g.192774 m.192774 type:complete len:419 (+) comp18274_c0_seq6:1141-2397(+)